MIDNLSTLNKQFQVTEICSLRRANNLFNRNISKLVKKLSKGESPESRTVLKNLKSQHVAKVSEELKHSSKFFRTQRTVYGGFFFNPLEISETFAEYPKSKVQLYDPSPDMQKAGINIISNSPLCSVLNKHNVTLADFLPSFDSPPPTHVSSCEIQSAISLFKSNSAPSLTGQGKKFFEFLFKFNQTFFTNAINRLMKIEKQEQIFSLKKANKCSDFRPISLLEVLYKILSKLLLEKLNPFMTDIVGSNQFGFTRGRAMSLCSLSTLTLQQL